MLKLTKYILFLFCCFAVAGCNKDKKITQKVLSSEERDTISLGLVYRSAVQTETEVKAPLILNETAVNNVNIYLFNEMGDVIYHAYSIGGTSLSGIVIYRNMRYRVYAIANAGESLPCKDLREVEAVTCRIDTICQLAGASGGILMSGKTGLQRLSDGKTVPVDLVRCVCKFLLKCDDSGLNPGVSVTVKRVRLKNAPKEIVLFRKSKAADGKVIDGEERTGPDLESLSGDGVAFYLFENRQGIVAPAALTNKMKVQHMSLQAKANSSYIEMEYEYVSPERRGTIIYRFYPGRTFTDCDIQRNYQYTCTVLFKGNGSAGENSWSVDNTGLEDRVTGITLDPALLRFMSPGDSRRIIATVLPHTAVTRMLTWRSSDPAVAAVDDTGLVTAVAYGSCSIMATSTDGTNISALCPARVVQPGIEFPEPGRIMYEGEMVMIPYKILIPNDVEVKVIPVHPELLEIIEITAEGVKVRAKSPGNTGFTAFIGSYVSAEYKIAVKPLEIIFNHREPPVFYQGFDDPVNYTISPAHAAGLKVNLSSSDNSVLQFMGDNVFRGGTPQASADIIATFADFPDKNFQIQARVKPALTVEPTFDLLANASESRLYDLKQEDIGMEHQILYDTHPTAKVQWSANTSGLYVDAGGYVSLDETTSLNGIDGYTITARIADLTGQSYEGKINVRIYEEVNICIIDREYAYNQDGEAGTMMEHIPVTNKPGIPADVHFRTAFEFRSMEMQFCWEEGVRPYIAEYGLVRILQRRSTRTSPGDLYCYYISYISEEIRRLNPI